MTDPTTTAPESDDERAASVAAEIEGAVLSLQPVHVASFTGMLIDAGHRPDLVTGVSITSRAVVITVLDSYERTPGIPRTSTTHVHPIARG